MSSNWLSKVFKCCGVHAWTGALGVLRGKGIYGQGLLLLCKLNITYTCVLGNVHVYNKYILIYFHLYSAHSSLTLLILFVMVFTLSVPFIFI